MATVTRLVDARDLRPGMQVAVDEQVVYGRGGAWTRYVTLPVLGILDLGNDTVGVVLGAEREPRVYPAGQIMTVPLGPEIDGVVSSRQLDAMAAAARDVTEIMRRRNGAGLHGLDPDVDAGSDQTPLAVLYPVPK